MTDLYIPDISEYQGDVDWTKFNAEAVIVRINYGDIKVDVKADRNIDGARSRCKVRGWYTYLNSSDSPVAAAGVLCKVLLAHGGLRPNEFIVCDDEEGTGDQSGRVNEFLNECDWQFKVPNSDGQDWWYSGLNFALAHNLQSARGHRWIAAYGQSEPSIPHDLWQFTSSNLWMVDGVNSAAIDMSVFHGDINQLISLIGGRTSMSPIATDPKSHWWGDYVIGSEQVVELARPCHAQVYQPTGHWYRDGSIIGVPKVGQFVDWTLANRINGVWYIMDESGGPTGSPAGRLPVSQSFWIDDSSTDSTGCGGSSPPEVAQSAGGSYYSLVSTVPSLQPPPQPPIPPIPSPPSTCTCADVSKAVSLISSATSSLQEALKILQK